MRTRDRRIAGASPNSSAVGTSSATVAASTVRFSVTGELAGSDSGMFATIASSESQASSTPIAAARQRQHHALGEQLPYQAAASRAE